MGGAVGRDPGARRRPPASGRTGPGARSARNTAPERWTDPWGGTTRVLAAHRGLLARGECRRESSAGAGPPGGCRRRGARGKSDASRAIGTGRGRPAGDRDDRAGLPGSADAAARRRGDCGRGPPADTGGCNRRGRDHRSGRGRRAAGTGCTPASGGSPRPRGPGAIRWAVDKDTGVCDKWIKPPTPPRGGCARGSGGTSSRPSSFSLRGRGSLPENYATFHSPCGRGPD